MLAIDVFSPTFVAFIKIYPELIIVEEYTSSLIPFLTGILSPVILA